MSNLDPAELERLTNLYCERAADEWAFLRESGAEIPLSDVYIMLEAAEEARREALDESSDLVPLEDRLERAGVPARAELRVKPPASPMPLEAALRESRRLVMLGEPGSGKSTTLQYIGLCYARRSVQTSLNLNEEHVPVRVPLGGYSEKIVQSKDGLWDVLTEAVRDFLPPDDKDQAHDLLNVWNREGRLLVLLDGLDEVPEVRRSAVTEEIRVLQGGLRQMCRIAAASRRAGYGPIGSPFKEFNLKPPEAKEARLYLVRWLRALRSEWDEGQAKKEAGKLVEQMNQRAALRRLTDNPQILKLAARNYVESHGNLAGNRAELYDRYIQGAHASREAPFSLHRLKEVLEDVAWAMHTEQTPETPNEEIDRVRLSSGLIAQVGERWAFAHFTLQEYFVARRLAAAWEKNPEWTWRFIKPRLQLPEWHEPLLLVAGALKKQTSEDLVRRVLRAGSAEEGTLCRDLRMAAEMIAENRGIKPEVVLKESRGRIKRSALNRSTKIIAVISALGQVGEAALPALPALPELRADLKDWHVREATARALEGMGRAALPELRKALRDPDGDVRWVAAKALGGMGEVALPALPELRRALKDPEWDVRGSAAKALGGMGEVALPELREALKDPHVRRVAIYALGGMGEAVLPELREALGNPDMSVRLAAAWALQRIDEAALPALPELQKALKDAVRDVREEAARALAGIGEAAVPELREALKDPDEDVRAGAARALHWIGEAGLPALPELREALKDPRVRVRMYAAAALEEMGEAALPALPELREALKDPRWDVRGSAAKALGGMGEMALPELREALKDPHVRQVAIYALKNMGEAALPALPDLRKALRDPDGDVRGSAAAALGEMGEVALPDLRKALKDPDGDVRSTAAKALGGMGEVALSALPDLRKALKDADNDVRWSTARVLGGMGIAAVPALPELREALKDPRVLVREEAARALGGMGKAALPALPELREALEDPHARWFAVKALRQIVAAALQALGVDVVGTRLRITAANAIVMILANTSSASAIPQRKRLNRLMDQLIFVLRSRHVYLHAALQLRERLQVGDDPYRDPWQAPPRSGLERAASFAGYFLSFVVLLGLAGVLTVLSGSASKVLGDQAAEGIKKMTVDHPVWMLVVVVGLLAALAGLLNFFLLDRIKERFKRR